MKQVLTERGYFMALQSWQCGEKADFQDKNTSKPHMRVVMIMCDQPTLLPYIAIIIGVICDLEHIYSKKSHPQGANSPPSQHR